MCIGVLVTKYVFIVHCVYWVYVCVFCTLSSVQSVNMYCPYVNCCFVFCTVWSTLVRISLTKALVLWWCDNKSDLIWFDLKRSVNVSTAAPERPERFSGASRRAVFSLSFNLVRVSHRWWSSTKRFLILRLHGSWREATLEVLPWVPST